MCSQSTMLQSSLDESILTGSDTPSTKLDRPPSVLFAAFIYIVLLITTTIWSIVQLVLGNGNDAVIPTYLTRENVCQSIDQNSTEFYAFDLSNVNVFGYVIGISIVNMLALLSAWNSDVFFGEHFTNIKMRGNSRREFFLRMIEMWTSPFLHSMVMVLLTILVALIGVVSNPVELTTIGFLQYLITISSLYQLDNRRVQGSSEKSANLGVILALFQTGLFASILLNVVWMTSLKNDQCRSILVGVYMSILGLMSVVPHISIFGVTILSYTFFLNFTSVFSQITILAILTTNDSQLRESCILL